MLQEVLCPPRAVHDHYVDGPGAQVDWAEKYCICSIGMPLFGWHAWQYARQSRLHQLRRTTSNKQPNGTPDARVGSVRRTPRAVELISDVVHTGVSGRRIALSQITAASLVSASQNRHRCGLPLHSLPTYTTLLRLV